jgi:hypothetical protein
MAISDNQKVDLLFKKLIFGKTKTDDASNKSPSNEAIASPLLIRGDKVWKQSASIPSTPPASSNSVITLYNDAEGNSVETVEDTTSTDNRTWKTNLTDWIPTEFGPQYIVKVYVDDPSSSTPETSGTRIYPDGSGNNDSFVFDYQSGVLHFPDTNVPSAITGSKVPYVIGYRYTGEFGVGAASGEDTNLGNLTISDTTLGTQNSGDDIILEPTGAGVVDINTTTALVVPVGTTAQEPGTPLEGMIRYNSDTDNLEFYNGTDWIGTASNAGSVTTEGFTGDNSTTDFTLNQSADTATVLVSLNGVAQEPNVAYTVSGTTLSFSEAPTSADRIEVRHLALLTSIRSVVDADGDTKVQVEATPDGDTVLLTAAGTDMLSVSANAITADSSYTPANNYDLTTKTYVDSEISSISLDLSSIDQHIVPSSDETYDLGSATNKWRDLYLSGNTITLGSAVISASGSAVTLPAGSTINGTNAATETYVDQAESDAISSANAYTDTRETAITSAYESYADQAEIDAKAYTDTRETAITSAYESYADQVEVDAKAYTDTRETAITSAYQSYTDSAVSGLASETYVDNAVSNLVDSAPSALDTLNELASALGDDANFSTTVTNNIASKLSLSGGTMTGNIDMGGNDITNAGTFDGVATTAKYADLAELYLADENYEPGTVVIFGGPVEVTACFRFEDHAVVGVVSTNPAYLMNNSLENGTPIALTGRVPVKVAGYVKPGDLLVTSSIPGHATVNNAPNAGTILGKAITGNNDGAGIVEALIILG